MKFYLIRLKQKYITIHKYIKEDLKKLEFKSVCVNWTYCIIVIAVRRSVASQNYFGKFCQVA